MGKILGLVFKIPLLGGGLKKLGERLIKSILGGLLKQGGSKNALKDLGKIAGGAAAAHIPDDLEDAGAYFLEGFAEGLEKAN